LFVNDFDSYAPRNNITVFCFCSNAQSQEGWIQVEESQLMKILIEVVDIVYW
jgi:hypothetical protein